MRRRKRVQVESDPPPSVAELIQAEREQIFQAMSVVDICSAACHSPEMDDDPERMKYALKAAYDILNRAAGELGMIADEQEKE